MEAKILVAAPVRNRAAQLHKYLESICQLDYPKHLLSFYWIINDCRDPSLAILEKFKEDHSGEYRQIVIDEINLNAPLDARTSIRRQVIYKNLAYLRNKMLDWFLQSDNEYLFSIDSDVYVNPDCLKRLFEANKDFISAEIANDFGRGDLGNTCQFVPNNRTVDPNHGTYTHFKLKQQPEIYEVDLTGAIFLTKKVVIESGARYSNHSFGEDLPFSEAIRKNGFKMFSMKGLAIHDMRKLEGER